MKVKCLLAVLLLSATATAFAQEAKYGIKSAILKKEAVTMGQKVQGVQYFDDYGRKECTLQIYTPHFYVIGTIKYFV